MTLNWGVFFALVLLVLFIYVIFIKKKRNTYVVLSFFLLESLLWFFKGYNVTQVLLKICLTLVSAAVLAAIVIAVPKLIEKAKK